MNTSYVLDLKTKPLEAWTKDEYENWLHPAHGRLPDHEGLVCCDGELYHVALWITENCLIACTEIVSFSDEWTEDEVDHLSRRKGWILNSLRWKQGAESLICGKRKVSIIPRDAEDDASWRARICREIAVASVEEVVTTPIGMGRQRSAI